MTGALPKGTLTPILGPETQLGFVVRDLDAAVRHWIDALGVGPFLFLEEGTGRPPPPALFRGAATIVETRLAFGYLGATQIEIIEQVNDAPSPYREFLAAGREGLQHLGYFAADYDEARRRLEAAGYVPDFIIPVAGMPESIVYYRAPELIGPMVEIVPPRWRRAREAVHAHLRASAGGDRLIRFRTYGEFLSAAGVSFA